MTTLTVDLPEALSAELDAAVEAGWFTSHAEAVRAAVRDSMNRRKLALLEDADKMVGGWMRTGEGK
jgi:Arc/MetJ-type ribon-helix-helix transcriptional regulator